MVLSGNDSGRGSVVLAITNSTPPEAFHRAFRGRVILFSEERHGADQAAGRDGVVCGKAVVHTVYEGIGHVDRQVVFTVPGKAGQVKVIGRDDARGNRFAVQENLGGFSHLAQRQPQRLARARLEAALIADGAREAR